MRFIVFILSLQFFLTIAVAQESELIIQLKNLTQEHFEAFEVEDFERIEATFHPDSPTLEQTMQATRQIAARFDLEYSVGRHWIYIGEDSDFAYARVEQETRRLDGPAFSDNAVDQIWVFRQYEGDWRVWSTGLLSVDYFMPSISSDSKRRSTYRSLNFVFDLTETKIVNCDSEPEFAHIASNERAVCGISDSTWERFSDYDLAIWSKEQLAPESWKQSDRGKYALLFDERDETNLVLTYMEGGFVTATPSAQEP